ncbi:MAG: metal-binding protein [Burkholderiales bacterium]|nr:metal-binding protein [Opitutaceae bacterium]
MNVAFSYLGRSGLDGSTLSLAPNLAREPVSFDAALRRPQRFREAISALHDVVISDHRFAKRDKTAYEAWKVAEAARLRTVRSQAVNQAEADIARRRGIPLPAEFEKTFARHCKTYWGARQTYAEYLRKHDLELWRKLMPCDPVITVAEDVVFFECFSADESSYGCLTVNRESGFGDSPSIRFGTTNVDYSWELFDHFQALRSYRETRFRLDPAGFDVATHGRADYREQKIDLPAGWLRGFMQLQAAMAMPMFKVTLTREAVYSLLVWLKRHKAATSPRALRFEQAPGQPLALVLEPWEQRIPVFGGDGGDAPWTESIRIWGRQRLLALARVLPLVESVDVFLLGTGFPSFWVANMGEMRLTLGLSGWTANDWTRGSSLDQLAPTTPPGANEIEIAAAYLQRRRAATFAEVAGAVPGPAAGVQSVLNHLAHTGQVIHDLGAGLFRWRQILPRALGEAELGPENAEVVASREIVRAGHVTVESRVAAPGGGSIFTGKAESTPVELLLDNEGRIKRGRCLCGHFRKAGLRMGPCRHLLALRRQAMNPAQAATKGGA